MGLLAMSTFRLGLVLVGMLCAGMSFQPGSGTR